MYITIRRLLMFLSVATLAEYSGVLSLGPLGIWTPNKLVSALLLGVAAVGLVLEPRRYPSDSRNWWVFTFFTSVLVSSVGSLVAGLPAGAIGTGLMRVASVVSFYYVLVWVAPKDRDLELVLWAVALGTAFVCLTAMLGFGRVATETASWDRSSGLGGNPNRLGYTTAAALPLTVALFVNARGTLRRAVLGGATLVILTGLLATLSRSAIVSLGVMGVFGMYRFGRFDLIRYVPIPVLLGVALVFVAPEQLTDRVETMTSEEARQEDLSIQSRLRDYQYGLIAFVKYPITGVGFLRFGTWAHENLDPTVGRGKNIHNAYLHVAADQGLVGLIPFLGMLAVSWRDFRLVARLARRFRARGDPDLARYRTLAIFSEIALVGTLVGNLFCTSLTYKIGWLLVALATILLKLTKERCAPYAASQAAAEAEGFAPGLGDGFAPARVRSH